ncbi:MAG: tetratricopeptide repeat protein [Thermoleophilia bacterium]
MTAFAAYYYYDRYVAPSGAVKTPDPIAALEEKVRTKPNDADLRLSLAENYLLYRRYGDAIAAANQVLEAYPKKDRALLVAGVSYALNEQPKEALEPLEKYIGIHEKGQAAALDTGLEAALYYQADSFLKLRRPAEAIKPLERAVGISPTDADALYLLGTANAAAGKHDNALVVLQKAVALVPDYTEAYQAMAASWDATKQPVLAEYARAMVDFSAKDYEAARDKLLAVVAKKKDFGPAFLGLGLAYEQLSDLKSAQANLKTALKLTPQSIAIQQALGRVEATQQQNQ